MRKRLTEKFTRAKKGSLGYTLTELLVVIGIIAAICAIAIPSIFAIRNTLRFATANNYAKSIFLAAQQNLTELRSDGGLGPVREAGGAYAIPGAMTSFPDAYRAEYVYTVTGEPAFERVLPAGSIDAELRNDQIVIEYNPVTGNVYSVFYFDKDAATLDLRGQYQNGTLPREKSERRDLMVGYYDGSGLNSSQIELEKTQAVVEFINGEEGIVQVKVPMPESFYGKYSDFAEGLNVTLSISGEWTMSQPVAEGETPPAPLVLPIKKYGNQDGCALAADGKTVVVTYVIDSLASRNSFVNFASNTQAATVDGVSNAAASLTSLVTEDEFPYSILPGENITIQADVTFNGDGSELVQIEPGILSGVNPMFEYLQPSGNGGYVLAVSNGRNLQNLNAIAPTIADMVQNVTFVSDIYWNDTVAYYNNKYAGGSTYHTGASAGGNHVYDEAPARALPYFVPIHNEKLFGTARFIYPGEGDGGLGGIITDIMNALTGGLFSKHSSSSTPTLTDELDNRSGVSHASIQGNGYGVYNINIDSTKYQVPNKGHKAVVNGVEQDISGTFYATGENQIIDYYFTGLFGYVNTPINSLRVVNPIVKGYKLGTFSATVPDYGSWWDQLLGRPAGTQTVQLANNPATGALLGAGGYNTLITDCSTYVDKNARGYRNLSWGPFAYDADDEQNWYGVSGGGAVGGLVGYTKSHHNVTGELTNDENNLAFARCFAALPVSGEMRTNTNKNFGYTNGVGAFIGNSQLTNFYSCYASGKVLATGCRVNKTTLGSILGLLEIVGINLDLPYDGRTSWGAGGFVGTSHGTRYTNCFSTGNVTASSGSSNLGAGGFVGFMSIDETFSYGSEDKPTNDDIAQRTVFTNCYSAGVAVTNGSTYENFSGANGRVALELDQTMTYYVGDYFRLYAPHYANQGQKAPDYEDIYIYRDTYFLSNYTSNASGQDSSSHCASPAVYAALTDMVGNHESGSQWMLGEIQKIKDIYLYKSYEYEGWNRVEVIHTYDTDYFQKYPVLNDLYKVEYSEGYSESEWESATASTTHPYSLTEGNRYPFTKLKGMDYYGDWPSKPSDVGLAYYETYAETENTESNTHYFFDQDHPEYVSLTLRDDPEAIVQKDGYNIFSASNAKLEVTIGNVTETLTAVPGKTYTVAQRVYHVFELTDKLMAQLPEDGEYYVEVTASHEGSDDTYTMYYNPNVGLSHVNPVEGNLAAVEPDKAPTTIYVRSARQFKGVATLDDFWTEDTRYVQELNIDASVYEWADENAGVQLSAIGIDGEKTRFESDYSAGYTDLMGEEQRYKIAGFESADIAFFGAIGEKGSVSNLIIECNNFTAGSDKVENAAILAAANYGKIENVALNINGNVTLTATNNAGMLAGLTTGDVTGCDVTTANDKTVNIVALNVGGVIGSVEGSGEVPEGKTEAELIAVNNMSLTVGGTLNLVGSTGNAGGLIGKATYMGSEDLRVNIKNLTGNTMYLGGLAGHVANATFTGVVADANGSNPVEVTVNSIASSNTEGYAAGVLGYAENTVITAMDATVGTVTGNIAAGYLGNSSNADANNCDVVVTSKISGTAGAAGVAGVIGPQSVFNDVPVLLSGVTIKGADAAGYALNVAGDAFVMANSHVTLGSDEQTKTTISATANAAGFAVTTAGSIGDAYVIGFGEIKGDQAAGYAVNVSGNIASCHVSPALTNDDYLGNSNANLAVSGKTAAAGFAMTLAKDSTIANSYALCSIAAEGKVEDNATAAYGFVGTNKGTINRCMNNVHIVDGFAFVGVNDGLLTTSYGWYGDGDRNNATTTRNEITGSGKCYSSYFADLEPVYRTDAVVALYNAEGAVSHITPSALQMAELAGFVGGYNEYPYTEMEESEKDYPYPMLRDHYGNWITPPQYAYGVAYYEKYADGSYKYQMVDLSNPKLTEEGQKNVTFPNDDFDNSGVITETGYAKFFNNQMGEMEGRTFQLEIGGFTFDFYKIDTLGETTIEATKAGTKSATVDTRFAKAIKVDAAFDNSDIFEIRTPEQLAKIGNRSAANFSQTHDIATKDVTSAVLGGTYNGNGLTLDIEGQNNSWLTSVSGTVTDLNLTIDAVTNSLFGDVSGEVNKLTLTIEGAVSGSVFNNITENGTVNVNVNTLGSVAAGGALVGTTEGTFSTGAITTGEIAATGALFRNVTGGTVEVGAITTGAVNGAVFADVSTGTVTTGAITTGNVSGDVFTVVAGNVTVNGDVTVGEVNGKVFNTVSSGEVEVVNITTGDIAATGNVFGSVSAPVTAQNIQIGALAGKVFGTISGNVNIAGVTATDATGENWLVGSVDGGESDLGDINVAHAVTNVTEEKNAQGEVIKTTTVTSYNTVPGMVGTVEGGSLTLDTVTLGKVTDGGWLIDSSSNATVRVGTVTVNNGTKTVVTTNTTSESNEYAPVVNMIGEISGGSVSGSAVNLGGASISGHLFSKVSGAALGGFTVNTSGMDASLIGETAASAISYMTVNAGSATTGSEVHGLLVDRVAAETSVANCVVNVDSVAVSASTFGGIAGAAETGASLSGNTVNAVLNVSSESATVGGLVGQMNGGSLRDSTASGKIMLASGNGTDGNYIVGGAVGKAGANTTYTNVTTTMLVDGSWGTPAFHNATDLPDAAKAIVSPNANGPVGQFVGYVDTGASFTGCYGNGGSDYYFLGQVKHTSTETFGANTYGGFEEPWGTNTYREADKDTYDAAKAEYNAAGVTIANFNVTLTDCYYMQGTASYQQSIGNTKYYSDGTDGTVTQYLTAKVDATATFDEDSSLKISNFTSYTSKTKTNLYHLHTDGKYYPVWAKYDYYSGILDDGHGLDLWVDLDWNGDATDNIVHIQRYDRDHMRDGNRDINKSISKTLYTPGALNLENVNYMIVGSDTHALMGSGTATNFATGFTADNQNLVSAIWTKDGNTWKQGSNYLNLSSALVGTSSNNISSSVAVTGPNGISVSLNGGKYLIYSNSTFGTGNNPAGQINLYRVTNTFLYEVSFTNDRRGQVIVSTPGGATYAINEVSDETESVVTE